MYELFEKYVLAQSALDNQQIRTIYSFCSEKRVLKNEFILREGEKSPTCFVAAGLLRLYQTDANGQEHILKFAHENRWISDRESYLNNSPSVLKIQALEDSEIITWRKSDFDHLLNEIPLFRQLMKDLSAKSQINNQSRLYRAISYSAEEKYTHFTGQYRAIINRVPLHMVASYLGLSRETLSRIRRQSVGK